MAGARRVQISFDDLNRVRILDASAHKHTESLADESQHFTQKLESFTRSVSSLVTILTSHADRIEQEKLKAIGARNRVESELETRQRKSIELQFLLAQKQAELQRLHDQYEALVKVEQEQKAIIEKLNKN